MSTILNFSDITNFKSGNSPLQQVTKNEFYYQQILNTLPVAVYMCDLEGYITYFNESAVNIWNNRPEQGKTRYTGALRMKDLNGITIPANNSPLALLLNNQKSTYGNELIIEKGDGTCVNVLNYPKPLFNAHGEMVGAVNTLIDITNQKREEDALKESEERFKNVANNAPMMMWMCNTDKVCNFLNKAWLEFLGNELNSLSYKNWRENIYPADFTKWNEVFNEAFNKRDNFLIEYRLKNSEGDYRWISETGIPRYTPNGIFEGYIGACSDIHTNKTGEPDDLEQKIAERTKDLTDANSALLRSNKDLEQFAYVASHDLQEPLRKIKIYTDRLEDHTQLNMDEVSRSYFEKIISSSDRMTHLIEDMLHYSRVINLNPEFAKVDLNDVLKNVLSDFELKIEQKNAEVKSQTLPVIEGIPMQINQLFHNLLSNALKFSKEGTTPVINVTCRLLPEHELQQFGKTNLPHCEIIFRDNGIGFNQVYAENIFMIFQRLNSRQQYEGSGIGLALCRKILNIHNGDIYAESKEGVGTAIHIIIPTKHAQEI